MCVCVTSDCFCTEKKEEKKGTELERTDPHSDAIKSFRAAALRRLVLLGVCL